MQTIAVRMRSKYQIVVPKPVREALKLGPDDALLFVVEDGTVTLRARPASFTQAMRGLHKEVWEDSEGWLERERDSWE